ncbi:MAG: SurA N-terminal domain-containing protein [Raoultibacter sp.]
MKTSRLIQVVFTATVTGALAFGMMGCTNASGNSKGLTGGVAATVNGTEIAEDTVTTYIQNFRETSSLMEEDAWGKWLAENSMTPEAVREQVSNFFAAQELIKKAAEENGVTVDDAAVNSTVDEMKSKFESDEAWQEGLKKAGTTEDEYRESVKEGLLEQQLADKVAVAQPVTNEEMIQYAQMYASAYDGAKKSSHILFATGDDANAQATLDKINAGELDFAAAAKDFSQDSGSATKGGDVGWDVLSNFVPAYTEALKGLQAGQVSGLVTSDYGIHIIKCTEVFTAPETVTSLDQIPAEFLENIKMTLEGSKKSNAFSTWYTDYKEKAAIEIKPMPENLPYKIDMSKYPAPEPPAADGAVSPDPNAGAASGENGGSAGQGAKTEGATEGAAQPQEGGTTQPANK